MSDSTTDNPLDKLRGTLASVVDPGKVDWTTVSKRPLPQRPSPLLPMNLQRAKNLEIQLKRGRSAGRQEGFIVPPKEVMAMIERALADMMKKRPEVRNPRMVLSLLLGFSLGLRATDITQLTWEQILNQASFRIRENKKKHRRAKRVKKKIVVVPHHTREKARFIFKHASERYLHPVYVFGKIGRRGMARKMEVSTTENPDTWCHRAFCQSFKDTCRRYGTPGISDNAYYSCCRPTYARWKYEIIKREAGHEQALIAAQADLNHSTPAQTMVYLKLGSKEEGVRRAMEDSFMNFDGEAPDLTSANAPKLPTVPELDPGEVHPLFLEMQRRGYLSTGLKEILARERDEQYVTQAKDAETAQRAAEQRAADLSALNSIITSVPQADTDDLWAQLSAL